MVLFKHPSQTPKRYPYHNNIIYKKTHTQKRKGFEDIKKRRIILISYMRKWVCLIRFHA